LEIFQVLTPPIVAVIEKKPQRISPCSEEANGSDAEACRKPGNLQMAVEAFEKQFILDALKQNQGHRAKTAAMLGIDRKTLYTKLKKYRVI
jgi:DNA-binding NtrC family response regulator